MSYAGVFDGVKIKNDSAEEKNLQSSLYFDKNHEEDAYHLLHLIQALIKANYPGAKDWYKELPKGYCDLLPKLKIEKSDIKR